MNEIPDSSNFFCSLHTSRSRREIAGLFGDAGLEVREPDDWDHLEVHCSWAELLIESASPILLHGPVADVLANGERIVALLEHAGVTFTAECYDSNRNLLREWRIGAADADAGQG